MGGSISKKTEGDEVTIRDGAPNPSSMQTEGAELHSASGSSTAVSETSSTIDDAGDGKGRDKGEDSSRVIPTVFRWEHGGNNVYMTGTFNEWGNRIPLVRSGNDFITIQNLTATKHAYKFVVDDEWRFAPDLTTTTDSDGNINNVLDLTNFNLDDDGDEDYVPWSTGTIAAAQIKRRDSLKDPTPYSHAVPEEDAYTKEPPNLPPHLRSIILNSPHPETSNPMMLGTPMHVSLNHLCQYIFPWCEAGRFFHAQLYLTPIHKHTLTRHFP